VRKTLQSLSEEMTMRAAPDDLSLLFDREAKDNAIVLYTTSTTGVRETYTNCENLKAVSPPATQRPETDWSLLTPWTLAPSCYTACASA
jgi:hypothetical protein